MSGLTGRWLGRFDFPDGSVTVPFEASLTDEAGTLTGDSDEPNTFLRGGPEVLMATLAGTHDGASVMLEKTYLAFDQQGLLAFAGQLNPARSRIEGLWSYPSQGWSGRFVMMRKPLASARREKAAKAPAEVR